MYIERATERENYRERERETERDRDCKGNQHL